MIFWTTKTNLKPQTLVGGFAKRVIVGKLGK